MFYVVNLQETAVVILEQIMLLLNILEISASSKVTAQTRR